jgi:hypothetical protein
VERDWVGSLGWKRQLVSWVDIEAALWEEVRDGSPCSEVSSLFGGSSSDFSVCGSMIVVRIQDLNREFLVVS